ncbi:hypothetical protein G7Y89_g13927 [Cudoniella acicularis]|uniref:Uncharacterized protein n=1 Tax=Cudoniella acicularis TaxID=354080 RepID=A0A8H4R9P8_9HELO|nr:hypothetical protein G7Y89_g13927 [Cudoniella acicularis]
MKFTSTVAIALHALLIVAAPIPNEADVDSIQWKRVANEADVDSIQWKRNEADVDSIQWKRKANEADVDSIQWKRNEADVDSIQWKRSPISPYQREVDAANPRDVLGE